jgi:RNA polymerase sigma-70 factor (ECF subfamily)
MHTVLLAIEPVFRYQARMDTPPPQGTSGIRSELLSAIAKGDTGAFEQLYDESSSLLFTLAFRILGTREETEELLQDVYAEVWRKIVRYDPARGTPTAWLVTLTRSRAIDRIRARNTRGHTVTDSMEDTSALEQPDGAPSPFDSRADRELRDTVGHALQDLPPAQREALELAYYDGLSHAEIATKLNQPLGTVKTRIKLGMDKLKAVLRPCWEASV